jgi:hypothetical protein
MGRAKRTLLALAVTGLFAAGTASPAYAIVHAVTPIVDAGAVDASGGAAGGLAALSAVSDTPAPGPPMPAQAPTELPTP